MSSEAVRPLCSHTVSLPSAFPWDHPMPRVRRFPDRRRSRQSAFHRPTPATPLPAGSLRQTGNPIFQPSFCPTPKPGANSTCDWFSRPERFNFPNPIHPQVTVRRQQRRNVTSSSRDIKAEDEKGELPYRIVRDRKFYLDELDVVSFLDGQTFLRPFESDSYNPALYLWKKIADVYPARRPRLLDLMEPRHLTAMWRVAQENPWVDRNTAKKSVVYESSAEEDVFDMEALGSERSTSATSESASDMLPDVHRSEALKPEFWEGKVCGLPWPVDSLSRFQKSFFVGKDGRRYGRVILHGPTRWLGDRITPLYFELQEASEVLATEESAQVSFDYTDGHLQLNEPGCLPEGFPRALPHPPKFNDDMRDYVCAVGPGVLVGQTWQEGKDLDAVPRKFLGEFVLIRST